MPSAEQTLLIARSQVGTLENPAGSNCQKYSKELGRPCEYWCMDGVSWVLKKAGVPDSPNTASTRAARDFYKARGRLDLHPQPGDVGLMHLTGRNGAGQPDHVGFVVSVQGSFVHTIEFNTSSTDAGSQDNGGGVFEKRRALSTFIGFGHPAYSTGGCFLMALTDPEQQEMLVKTREIHTMAGNIQKVEAKYDNLVAGLSAAIQHELASNPSGGGLTQDQVRSIVRSELANLKLTVA